MENVFENDSSFTAFVQYFGSVVAQNASDVRLSTKDGYQSFQTIGSLPLEADFKELYTQSIPLAICFIQVIQETSGGDGGFRRRLLNQVRNPIDKVEPSILYSLFQALFIRSFNVDTFTDQELQELTQINLEIAQQEQAYIQGHDLYCNTSLQDYVNNPKYTSYVVCLLYIHRIQYVLGNQIMFS